MFDKNIVLYNEEVASRCVYGADFVKDILSGQLYNNIFIPEQEFVISTRKLEGFKKLARYRNYYQQNPVKFIKDFFNIQLLDSQAWLLTEAWNKGHVLILASRAYGKSFFMVLFIMAKQMLSIMPWNCYIASGSSQQSATTFKKLEDIANDRIDSLINSNGKIFKDELVIKNAAGDGFSHNPAGYEYQIYNGSFTKTLNSNVDKNRGARASCVCFDEVSWLSADLIQVYQAFCAVDKDFKTGVDDSGQVIDPVSLYAYPKEVPNQLVYVSSASSTDTEFYRMYREFSKRMLMGDPDYFVADINCDLVLKPTIGNKKVKPALTKEMIDIALKTNPEKARREYFNLFSTDGGENAIIRRGVITRNEKTYKPILYNDTGQRKIIITYDPARSRDNSVILVMEIFSAKDINGDIEYKGRLLNCINLIDIGKKRKSPMQTPDQIDYLKEVILDYNQGGDENYSNILGIYIDAGSGGGGVNIADFLMEDWIGKDGKWHKGLIDKEYSKDYVKKFPNAVDKIHLMSPSQYKSIMYEAMIEMINQNKVEFTASYDNKGYLTVFDIDEEKLQKEKEKIIVKLKKKKLSSEEFDYKLQEEIDKIQNVETRKEGLDWQEEISLTGIDALKEELVNMVRIKRESGKDSFELTAEKRNKLNDDRAYCCCMACYALSEERRKNITSRKKNDETLDELLDLLEVRRGVRPSAFTTYKAEI